jgi:hypothetical protein
VIGFSKIHHEAPHQSAFKDAACVPSFPSVATQLLMVAQAMLMVAEAMQRNRHPSIGRSGTNLML